MQINKDINLLTKKEFLTIFGIIFEKSEWIAEETFDLRPFDNSEDLINKMISIYENTSNEKIMYIFNLHPKLVIEKNLTSYSSKEQRSAKLNNCTKEELEEFKNLNIDYEKKFGFPFIIAVKGKNKNEILDNFRKRIKNSTQEEFNESKIQVKKIALLRLNDVLK
jgi:2-oxo-4-hydroxy-4-carboxy-5-ureidoimidazoline decarboxylase